MDIEEAQRKKANLERDIWMLISKFQKDTGLHVEYLTMRVDEYNGDVKTIVTVGVNL